MGNKFAEPRSLGVQELVRKSPEAIGMPKCPNPSIVFDVFVLFSFVVVVGGVCF